MPNDFALKPPSYFAPADRAPIDQIHVEQALAVGAGDAVLDALPEPIAVVNEFRQIVFANRRFLQFAQLGRIDDVLGLRLGEILGCVHATGDTSGCGTHAACRVCGAVLVVLHALAGRPSTSAVELVVQHTGGEQKLRFEVAALPLAVASRFFAVLRIEASTATAAN